MILRSIAHKYQTWLIEDQQIFDKNRSMNKSEYSKMCVCKKEMITIFLLQILVMAVKF